jgi:hypothetical protein
MASQAPINFAHKAMLIEGEVEARNGNFTTSLCKFQQSIQYALEHGFIQDQALACERAACMLEACDQTQEALEYRDEALRLYSA